jgi:hypothetical protein
MRVADEIQARQRPRSSRPRPLPKEAGVPLLRLPGLIVVCLACGSGDETALTAPPLGCAAAALLGGTAAPDPAYDAIGALGLLDADGRFRPFCSATLIAVDTILTAKHCTMTQNGRELSPDEVFFGVGFDAEAPRRLVATRAMTASPPKSGGVSQLGSDVALYQLAHVLNDVLPFALSPLGSSELLPGLELAAYGHGPVVSACSALQRRVRRRGELVVGASQGNVFDQIYGDYATYLERAVGVMSASELVTRYENGVLLDEYEAWGRDTSSGSQTCHGDSGGPMVLEKGLSAGIVGVTSWSWRSSAAECAHGTVFATFGPEVRAHIERAFSP